MKVLAYFNDPGKPWKYNKLYCRWEVELEFDDDDYTEDELSDFIREDIEEEIFAGNWGFNVINE